MRMAERGEDLRLAAKALCEARIWKVLAPLEDFDRDGPVQVDLAAGIDNPRAALPDDPIQPDLRDAREGRLALSVTGVVGQRGVLAILRRRRSLKGAPVGWNQARTVHSPSCDLRLLVRLSIT
jgi:hypothetical protein